MTHAARHRRRTARPAFTLVELMISIALVALLILGVNQVFLYTSQAVGSGEAINDAVRGSRAVQTVLANDFAGSVPNGSDPLSAPSIVITSTSVYAYRNAADQQSDRDGNVATIDLDGGPTEGDSPGETVSPVTYNFRNHRTDTLSFFSRGTFPRQTGGSADAKPTPFVADMSSPEAWVWYGHLALPDNSGALPAYTDNTKPAPGGPGVGTVATNPNDAFASQFVLGRDAVLLRSPQATFVYDNANNGGKQIYLQPASLATNWTWPLAFGATANMSDPSNGTTYQVQQSRYDLAAGSMQQLQQALVAQIGNVPLSGTAAQLSNYNAWWTSLSYNFQVNPFLAKPVTPTGMAQASPYFLKGCSQFIVEFAGDFVTQNQNPSAAVAAAAVGTGASPNAGDGTYGDVLGLGGDGTTDFWIDKRDPVTGVASTNTAIWKRHVRWYGLPRDDDGDGQVTGWSAGVSNNDLRDVVPVRDVVRSCYYAAYSYLAAYTSEPFEKFSPIASTAMTDVITPPVQNYAMLAAGTPATYTCVFGPNDPRVKLIRITITLDDPTGHLRDGQTYQYVFPVGGQ